jgi:putative glycosyltransferase (TIGR04372 family)
MINKKNIIRVLKYEKDLILTLPLSLPFLFFLIIVYPFIKIKVGFLRSDRIGHFTLNTELYLLEKKNNKIKSIDLFYLGRKPVCNITLEKLWRKELIIFPRLFLRPLCIQIRFFKLLKFLRCGNTVCDERDILNLLDKYPSTIKLSHNDLIKGDDERLKIGLPNKAKFICLIVRDSAYLDKIYINENMSMHDYRNADVNDFLSACEALTELGYYVIRMGSIVKKPINSDNKMIIDYAYNNLRTDFMDIYLASQCEFCLTTGTGFDGITAMFRKPNIYVNSAPLFFLRTECSNMLSIPCYYYSKNFSRNLTISEIVNKKSAVYLEGNFFQSDEIELIKNSPEEIKQLAIEAVKRQKKEWQDNEGDKLQEKFREVFPSKKEFDKITYHGEIKGRIGSDFLKKNQWWLN